MPGFRRLFAPEPPPQGASQEQQWRWVRSVQLRQLCVTVPILLAIVIAGAPALLVVAAALGVAVGAGYALFLTAKIRRS